MSVSDVCIVALQLSNPLLCGFQRLDQFINGSRCLTCVIGNCQLAFNFSAVFVGVANSKVVGVDFVISQMPQRVSNKFSVFNQ